MTPACVRRLVRRAGLAFALTALGCGGEGNARVTVPAGATMREAADSLEAAGVVGSARAFGFYAKLTGRDRSIKPGLYILDRAASWNAVVDALVAGKGIVLTVTIPAGWDIKTMVPVIAETMQVRWGPIDLELPQLDSIQWVSVAITVLAALMIFKLRWSVLRTLGVCALLGIGAALLGLPVA